MQIEGLSKDEVQKLENCPYRCVNGKVFVEKLRSFQDCPHCASIYKKMSEGTMEVSKGKNIFDILAIPRRYKNRVYNRAGFFPRTIVETTTQGSRDAVLDKLDFIKSKSLCGELLDNDYLFYVGLETDVFPFVFDTLKGYFKEGRTVVPYLSIITIRQLFKNFEAPNSDYKPGIELENETGKTYSDICRSDICIVSLPPASGSNSINMLFTLLRERRLRGKSTIVFSETQGVSRQLGYVLNSDDFETAFIQSVKKESKKVKAEIENVEKSEVIKETVPISAFEKM